MGIISSIVIPGLVGIFFIGLVDLILFVKGRIIVKKEHQYRSEYNSTGTYFLKGLRDPFETKN